jgi:hypothetical protein
MELLLNLAWLLLALPAWWMWRSGGHAHNKFSSQQRLLTLGCLLVVLFPVISATDDLHVMRAEIEESPAGKRDFRSFTGEKASPWSLRVQPSAILDASYPFIVGSEAYEPMPDFLTSPHATPVLHVGRAPPTPHPASFARIA